MLDPVHQMSPWPDAARPDRELDRLVEVANRQVGLADVLGSRKAAHEREPLVELRRTRTPTGVLAEARVVVRRAEPDAEHEAARREPRERHGLQRRLLWAPPCERDDQRAEHDPLGPRRDGG